MPRTDHDRHVPRERDRLESKPVRKRDSPPAEKVQTKKPQANGDVVMKDDAEEDVLMKKMMGFSMFKSTKNKKVPGNQIYGVRKEKKSEYRQYMNRVGGFNRPLDAM